MVLGGGVLYLLLRYLLFVLLPFLLAWLISLAISSPAKRLAKACALPEKLCAVLLLLLTLVTVLLLLGLAVVRLTREVRDLLEGFLAQYGSLEALTETWVEAFRGTVSRVGLLANEGDSVFGEKLYAMVSEILTTVLSALASKLPALAGRLFAFFPSFLFGAVITVISAFYLCVDRDRVLAALSSLLPRHAREKLPYWRSRFRRISFRYLRAYFLLLLISFSVLLIGFLFLRLPYAFLLAMVVAIVDLLPVLGVGTVLIPWALILLVRKSYYLAFGLLILYVAVTLIRQIAEPRLVGKSLGVHPLLTVFFTYVGWYLFGLVGILLSPLCAWLARILYQQGHGAGEENGD